MRFIEVKGKWRDELICVSIDQIKTVGPATMLLSPGQDESCLSPELDPNCTVICFGKDEFLPVSDSVPGVMMAIAQAEDFDRELLRHDGLPPSYT